MYLGKVVNVCGLLINELIENLGTNVFALDLIK